MLVLVGFSECSRKGDEERLVNHNRSTMMMNNDMSGQHHMRNNERQMGMQNSNYMMEMMHNNPQMMNGMMENMKDICNTDDSQRTQMVKTCLQANNKQKNKEEDCHAWN
nr:hypothetical protein [uncultured Carboxylicivirga sp.]